MRLFLPLALSLLALSCKPSGHGLNGAIPSQEIVIQALDNNFFPLEPAYSDSDSARFVFHSEDCLCHFNPMLVCRHCSPERVTVNGQGVEAVRGLHLTDDDDECYIVSAILHDGENVIELGGTAGVPSLCLLGNFSVRLSDSGQWCIFPEENLTLGDVASQGLPFYEGEVSYSHLYVIPETGRRCVLRTESWKGGTCEVYVNGEKVCNAKAGRFRKNVAPWLKAGVNCIELRIRSYPADKKKAPREWGLMEDFHLISSSRNP